MFRKKRTQDRSENSDCRLEPLILHNSRMKFSAEQLHNLNFIFYKKLQSKQCRTDTILLRAKNVGERLVQRLLCVAGSADQRFASKFLIDNNPEAIYNNSNKTLSFLVRLDELSTPPLYDLDPATKLEIIENDSDCPSSYCKIRIPSSKTKTWNEFINPNGFLRRDKVQTRLVKLLAEAADKGGPLSPRSVDESVVCSIPGKIVDAATLNKILKVPSFEQLYYGPGGKDLGFPDPSNFRIAIVDEPQGIILRLEFLSPAYDNICLDIRLLIAIGVDAWPSSTSYPGRIPLIHPDCLLYHMAAETGMYLVGFGVQSSAWQIRVPAAEYTILNHYGITSTIRIILDILKILEEEIDIPRRLKQYQYSYKILHKYIYLTALFEELESNSIQPLKDAVNWSSMHLSRIVLIIMDKLIFNLTQQRLSNYFFKQANLMVNPGHLSEDDYIIEANNVKMFIYKLFDESLQNLSSDDQYRTMTKTQENEINLLIKWAELIEGMLPHLKPKNNGFCLMKSRKMKNYEQLHYSRYQLEYISLVLWSILNVRKKILKSETTLAFKSDIYENEARVEDVIYLTIILMDQARYHYMKNMKQDKKQSKFERQYVLHTSKFIELLREDQNIKSLNLEEDIVVVGTIVNMLHRAVDFEEKYIGRVLQPYLKDLYEISFVISWHLEDIKRRLNDDELKSLGCFCKLVNSGEITPEQGLEDALEKNWTWAKDMMELIEKREVRIFLIPDREKVNQYVVYPNEKSSGDTKRRNLPRRKDTLLGQNYFNTLRSKGLSRNNINIIRRGEDQSQ
ncbi:uncharacterized protein LOC123683435 isoform X2 [Harmonia axyridis]|uniref:uncharacterized protein LOC123683435 isoform X2 n=1 Tax=Harmonia axyridis TaxID=115357 RepID=UPI001E275763|nr:uncharacterized protein LOC123683435 isoform X2 [Harmonia axyridis]